MRRNDGAAEVDGRQAAVAEAGIKALIPIDRPFLDYVLSAAADGRLSPRVSGDRAGAGGDPRILWRQGGGREARFQLRLPSRAARHGRCRGRGRGVRRRRPLRGDQFRQLLSGRGASGVARAVGPGRGAVRARRDADAATCPRVGSRASRWERSTRRAACLGSSRSPTKPRLASSAAAALGEHELLAVRAVDFQGVPRDYSRRPAASSRFPTRFNTLLPCWASRLPR